VDYKHLLKRFRNTLLHSKGVTIEGALITAAVLRRHLRSTQLSEESISTLLSASDRQNVKLAYDLLSAIADLPCHLESDSPTFRVTRTSLRLLGAVYAHFLETYTNINLSLHEQLVHLSAAAHLILAIYSKDKGGSMPAELYYDMMTTVKNVYFCVGKTQLDTPEAAFWIILLGMDGLEGLFGLIRTIVGNDTNADQLQLGNCVESAAICAKIVAENPSWIRGPRRITLRPWRENAGDVSAKVDHINPASWRGDVSVKNVVPLTSWEGGRRAAEKELEMAGISAPFADMDKGEGFDMFCPFGKGKIVLMNGLSEGERNEDEEEQDNAPPPSSDSAAPGSEGCIPDTPDLEDLALTEILCQDSQSTLPFEAYIDVNPGSDKDSRQHKSAVLRILLKDRYSRGATERLRRIARQPQYALPPKPSPLGIESPEPCIEPGDPAALLLCSKDLIWLSIVEVIEIRRDSTEIEALPVRLLSEPNVRATVRSMCLKSLKDCADGDWEWTGAFEPVTCHVEGRMLQVVDPSLTHSSRPSKDNMPTYCFHSYELVSIAAVLFGNLRGEIDNLPKVPWTDTFPYRSSAGISSYYQFLVIIV
jgi:hypothetical protein